MTPKSLTILSIILFLRINIISSLSESEALLHFKSSLQNASALSNWTPTISPCSGEKANWVGVVCVRGRVWGLKLENMGLSGTIDVTALKELPLLRALSLKNNNFEGNFPYMTALGALKSLYLSNNKFFGEIPGDTFDGMLSLKKVFLANNKFTNVIPLSLTILPKLIHLSLEGNQFSGEIPNFHADDLKFINVSNNNLFGRIPEKLSRMNASSFQGNKELCGAPLGPCPSNKKLPITIIVVAIASVVVAVAAIIMVIIILHRRRPANQDLAASAPPPISLKKSLSRDLDKTEQGNPLENSTISDRSSRGRLTFMKNNKVRFELTDLMKASAEVLGSGYFGSSYKATMLNRQVVVVKRFKQMNNMGKVEFEEHMNRIGRLSHPNLLPIVAYYYRREEKLLIGDYVDNVSLAVHLHGNRNRELPTLDWSTRLKIIRGVGQGLVYLYKELPGLIVAHGHLKSSNVLLNKGTLEPILTDYGLIPLIDQEHAQQVMVAYKSPEYKYNNRVTKKTDVWSFGIFILEMLTGIIPTNYLQQGKGNDTDLVTLVNSMIHEDKKHELFDKDMGGTENREGSLMKLLRVALACAEPVVENRLGLNEAIEKIEEIRDNVNDDDECHSSYIVEEP